VTRTHRILIGTVATSFALLISACGTSGGASDGGKDDTTTTKAEATTTTEEETTTTTAVDDEEAQDRADSVDVSLSDFPDGWDSAEPDDPDAESPLNDCDPALGDRSTQLARHATDDFSIGTIEGGDGVQFTARTAVFEDEAAAEDAVAPFSDPDVVSCIDGKLKEAYTSSGEGITVEGTLEPADVDLGTDETVGLSASYTVSADDGSSLDVNLGVLVMRTGDIATNVLIQSVDPNFDVSTLPVQQLADLLNAA
jgi:hypothetical protein